MMMVACIAGEAIFIQTMNCLFYRTIFSFQKHPPLVVDLVAYSHVQIDRTAVLLDVWSQEIAFQKNKKKVMIDPVVSVF